MLFACISSAVARADGARDESSVAAMVKAIEVKQEEQMAKRAVQMAKQEEQIREQMAVQRLALTDAAANEPPIRILALALIIGASASNVKSASVSSRRWLRQFASGSAWQRLAICSRICSSCFAI